MFGLLGFRVCRVKGLRKYRNDFEPRFNLEFQFRVCGAQGARFRAEGSRALGPQSS